MYGATQIKLYSTAHKLCKKSETQTAKMSNIKE